MYKIVFYEDKNGYSELYENIIELATKSINNKDARIQYKQVSYYIELLKTNGNTLPSTILKHVKDEIWELRPGNNRVFYFFLNDDVIVLLHMFRKKTNKTPKSEIIKAQKEMMDYIIRNGG